MRTITRNLVVFIVAVVAFLLALGVLPGYIQTGNPHYVEATAVEESGPSADVTNLTERRFPYTFGALAAAEAGDEPARSEAYYTGPIGFKEAFTHTPFDEFSEFRTRNASAVERGAESPVGDTAYVERGGQRYRLEIVRVESE
jgi:hypothetical protein